MILIPCALQISTVAAEFTKVADRLQQQAITLNATVDATAEQTTPQIEVDIALEKVSVAPRIAQRLTPRSQQLVIANGLEMPTAPNRDISDRELELRFQRLQQN